MRQNRINTSVTGNLISGVIAGVIYALIALLTGSRGTNVVVVSVIVGAVTFVVAFTINKIVRQRQRGTTR